MPEGVSGAMVDTVEACAGAMSTLLKDRALAEHLGQRRRQHVRERFLLPRLLMEELRLLATLDRNSPMDTRPIGRALMQHAANSLSSRTV